MADIRYLARTQDGQLYWAVGPQANVPLLIITTPPGVVGVPEPGQTVTITGGVYEPPGMTRISLEVTLRDASGNIVEVGTTETFEIPQDAGSGTLTVEETMLHAESGITIIGTARVEVTAVSGAPVFQSRPVITASNPTPGGVITSTTGTVTGSPTPTLGLQWLRDGVPVPGAIDASYEATEADVGTAIRLRVTAANSAGSAVVESDPVFIVAAAQTAPKFTGLPTIARDPNNAEFLIATNAPVSGAPTPELTNRWYYRDDTSGVWTPREPTNDPYRWRPDPVTFAGKYITCATLATNEVVIAPVESGKASNPIRIPPVAQAQEGFTAQPSLSGEGSQPVPQGSTVTLNPGTWHGSPTEIEYLWFRIAANGTATALSTSGLTREVGELDGGNKIGARVRIKYSTGSEFFGPSATGYTNQISVAEVTGPVDPEEPGEPTNPNGWPAVAGFAKSSSGGNVLDKAYVRFVDGYAALASENDGSNQYHHAGAIAGYEAWRGNTAAYNYVEGAIKHIFNTRANAPNIEMAYGCQYCFATCCLVYFASKTPAVWNRFTAREKEKMDAFMKLGTIAAMAVTRRPNDRNLNMLANGRTNATAVTSGANPNIRTPHYAWPQVFCAYMGPSAANTYLRGRTEANIKALRDSISSDMPRTAAAFSNSRPSLSPSWDMIVEKTTRYESSGLSLTDHVDLYVREMNHMYSQRAFVGLNNGQGDTRAAAGRNQGRGRFENVSRVRGLAAYQAIDGQLGMCHEMNTGDAGGARSSMSYATFADSTATLWGLVGLTSGLLPASNSKIKALLPRLRVSQAFQKLADTETYLSSAQSSEAAGSARYGSSQTWHINQNPAKQSIVPTRRSIAQIIIDRIAAA